MDKTTLAIVLIVGVGGLILWSNRPISAAAPYVPNSPSNYSGPISPQGNALLGIGSQFLGQAQNIGMGVMSSYLGGQNSGDAVSDATG